MKFVTIEIGGITQSVPEADVAQYLRAGYRRVDEKPAEPAEPVAKDPAPVDESEVLKKINEATSTKDLYEIQDLYPVRSPLVEDALNAKGQELMSAEKPEPVEKPITPDPTEKPARKPK